MIFLKILKTGNLPYYLLFILKNEKFVQLKNYFSKILINHHLQDNCQLLPNTFSDNFYSAMTQVAHLHGLNQTFY